MKLNLAEELLLLSLDAESGEILLSISTALPYGIVGAVLLELYLADRISINDNIISLKDASNTGDEILDDALKLIAEHNKDEIAKYWILTLNSEVENLRERCITSLINKGILKRESKKLFWIIPIERFPSQDVLHEVNIRLLIRSIVLENIEPDKRNLALLSLVKSTNLVDELFLKEESKQATSIINDYIKGESIGKAIIDVTSEIAAIIASSVAGTAIIS